MSTVSLLYRYSLFAALATLVNLATQETSVHLYAGAYDIPVSILAGTVTGLLTKYLLDKHYIFAHRSVSLSQEARVFVLYASMSVVTTLIFWATEYAFHLAFGTKAARYTGAVIGLTVGYLLKYQLDRRYVFADSDQATTSDE